MVLVCVFYMGGSSDADSGPVSVSSSDFPQLVLANAKPVIVDFWAEWCAPCLTMRPVFERLSRAFSGKVLFASLNVDQSPDVAAKFAVLGIPTFLLFVGGELVERIIGVCGEEVLRRAIERHLLASLG